MRLSRRTLVALADALSGNGHTWFNKKFYELGLESADPGGNLGTRALGLVRALENPSHAPAEQGPDEKEREATLLELAEDSIRTRPIGSNLLEDALKVDGFEYQDGRLVPTTPEPVALAPEISALESGLSASGFQTAATHYRQAVDNLTDGNAEACNGQVRSYLEDLFCELGARYTGKKRDDPAASLSDLRDAGYLDWAEWNTFRGFWQACQDKGPHRGLSDFEEALYRTHVATAVGRYLLSKLD